MSARSLILTLFLAAAVAAGCGDDEAASGGSTKQGEKAPAAENGDAPAATPANAEEAEATKSLVTTVENAIETCAAGNADGSYGTCLSPEAIRSSEPSLAGVKFADAPVPPPQQVSVAPLGGTPVQGYAVAATTTDGLTFAAVHSPEGDLRRTCGSNMKWSESESAYSGDDSPGACDDGTW